MLNFFANIESFSTLSQALGAKQLVVDIIHTIEFAPSFCICVSNSSKFVMTWSSSWIVSMITGIKFADKIALKQLFWSILDQSTYLASFLWDLKVRSEIIIVIPVARGIIIAFWALRTPIILIRSRTRQFVNWAITVDPAALGWASSKSPLRPIPWPKK